EFKTKAELAFEIVENQWHLGTGFDFVGADGIYGNDTELTDKIDALGCLYMLYIHSNQQIVLEVPKWAVPKKTSTRVRPPTVMKPDKPSFRADEYCKALEKGDWTELKVRNNTKGKLKGKYHFCDVFVLNKTRNTFEKRLLVIRRVKTKG